MTQKVRRTKAVVICFLAGIVLILLLAAVLSKLGSKAPALSENPEEYLSAQAVSAIRQSVVQGTHPNTYLNAAEIAAIKQKVAAGNDPWQMAYVPMIELADATLEISPGSVTTNGGLNNGHDYQTQSIYCGWTAVDGREPDCRDGQKNPAVDRQDYEAAIALGKEVSTLGLAYALTTDEKYAQKLLSIIRVWCLDEETRMTPKFTNQQSKIELAVSLPGLFYGADLAYDYEGWSAADKAGFEAWSQQMAQSALPWHRLNNFESWRVNLIALIGAFLKDEALLDYAFGRYIELLPIQINHQGQFVEEIDRANSLSYSLYALNAMVQIAELARHQGLDLYDYTVDRSDGEIGLKLAVDYHAQFANQAQPDDWSYAQTEPLEERDSVALYEMAYTHWHNPSYLKVISYWGRPMVDRRVHWHMTLTHASEAAS